MTTQDLVMDKQAGLAEAIKQLPTIPSEQKQRAVSRRPEYEREAGAHVDETKVVASLLGPSTRTTRVMIDVGAHYGGSAKHFVDGEWRIYCFEPDPANRQRLIENYGGKPNVTIDARAVGEQAEGRHAFFSSPESTGISTLQPFRNTHTQSAVVDVTTISHIVEEHGLTRIDFLKIDTEGWDFQVLRGVPWDRVRPSAIECEFEDAKTVPLGYSHKDMADFLVAKGYVVYMSEWHPVLRYGVPHDWCRLVKYPERLRTPHAWGNLLAFVDAPTPKAVADAFNQCVRLRTGSDARQRERARPSLAPVYRRVAGWMADKLLGGFLQQQRAELERGARKQRAEIEQQLTVLQSRLQRLEDDHTYRRTVREIRVAVREALPQDATVVVVSKGDDDLLDLCGRRAWHFPCTRDGVYAGYYPSDSMAAITHLEALRAQGAEFLLVPNTSFWWFDHYPEFKRHLDACYSQVPSREACCLYQLSAAGAAREGT